MIKRERTNEGIKSWVVNKSASPSNLDVINTIYRSIVGDEDPYCNWEPLIPVKPVAAGLVELSFSLSQGSADDVKVLFAA